MRNCWLGIGDAGDQIKRPSGARAERINGDDDHFVRAGRIAVGRGVGCCCSTGIIARQTRGHVTARLAGPDQVDRRIPI